MSSFHTKQIHPHHRRNPRYHFPRSWREMWAMLHQGAQPESAFEVFHSILQRADGGRDCQNCTTTSTAPWVPNFEERWMWKADRNWWECNGMDGVYKWHYGIQRIHRCWVTTQSKGLEWLVICSKVETQIKVIQDFGTISIEWMRAKELSHEGASTGRILCTHTTRGTGAKEPFHYPVAQDEIAQRRQACNYSRNCVWVLSKWGLWSCTFFQSLVFLSSSSGTRCTIGSISSLQKQLNVHSTSAKRTRQLYSRKSKMTVSFNSFCVKLTRSGQGLQGCRKCLKTRLLKSFGLGC